LGQPKADDARLTKKLLEYVRERPRWGYRRIAQLLRRSGELINVRRVYRVWKAAGLKVPRNRRIKRAIGNMVNACHLRHAGISSDVWSWDFVQASTVGGKTVRFLNIVNEYTRVCLSIKTSRSITSEDAIDTLAELFAMHGVPKRIRSDYGPQFISAAIKGWLWSLGIEVLYIEPGSPWQSGVCESFNSKLRDEYLSQTELLSEHDARLKARAWQQDFNEQRPHSSLGYLTPLEFARRCGASSPLAPPNHHNAMAMPLPTT
jgi:putative transposase